MARSGSIITNPATGETCKWHLTAESTEGRLVRAEFWVRPGGGVPGLHIHPRAEERFEVLGGRMRLQTAGETLLLGPGDQRAVPAGSPHAWTNDGDDDLHFFVEVSPAGRFEEVIEAAFSLGRAAHAAGRARPGLLDLALTFAAFRDEVVATSPPRWLQPLAFGVLVPLARLTGRRPHRAVTAALSWILAAVVLCLAAPTGARAAAVVYDGDALVLRAAPGEKNFVVVDGTEPGRISFTDDQPIAFPADRCEQSDPEYPVSCQAPSREVRLELGDGDDNASFGFQIPATLAFRIEGGPGNDLLKGPRNGIGSATLDGGPGDDDLRSEETADTLLGGDGTDKLEGGAGADVLHGGDGNDFLRADAPGAIFGDVIDGGGGSDTLDEYADGDAAAAPPVDILLDGIANDGRAGENDNITSVETIKAGAVRTFVGDDDANTFFAPEKGGAARIDGGGGDDVLQAGDAHGDHVDGGPGNDRVSGGMGDDVISGGPGRDEIAGDRPGRCNELHCDITDGYGNDTIDARDGEADSVSCGPGTDTVRADAIDTIAPDCEQVDTGGSAGKPGPSTTSADAGRGPATSRATAALRVAGAVRLRTVLARGLRVHLTHAPARATVALTATARGRAVAAGRGRTRADGSATVTLRFNRAARRRLRHARSVRVVVKGAGARAAITLR